MRYFPNWLKAFTEYSSIFEAPMKMYFWAGVSAVAGALRRRVWIDERSFQWVPNLYVIFVAPPGVVTKSTTASVSMKLLREVPEIKFGPSAITWQRLVTKMGESTELAYDPKSESYLPMSCLTIESSELGNLINPRDQGMIDAYIAMWDGQVGVFDKETKNSGKDSIQNPCLNIIACTTPAWLSENFSSSLIGGGFVSRCVWVYAQSKRQVIAYPHALTLPSSYAETAKRLIADLEQISLMIGEFSISPEAEEYGSRWYSDLWQKAKTVSSDQLMGQLARRQTMAHKLAIILSAAEGESYAISLDHLQNAIALVESLEPDSRKIFSFIGQKEDSRLLSAIVDAVISAGSIEKRTLFRSVIKLCSWDDFSKTLDGGVASGLLSLSQKGNELWVGRARDVGQEGL